MVANASLDMTPGPTPAFGHFELRRLLGKSAATMVWLAVDRRTAREAMLTLPHEVPGDGAALMRWIERTRHAARLDHPGLASVTEIGVHRHWPFIAVDRGSRVTLREWCATHANTAATEVAGWFCAALRGLAYAHEAGTWHGDLQLHHLLIDERGKVCVMGLGAAGPAAATVRQRARGGFGLAMDTDELRDQRSAAERDVLACGVLLHHVLGGEAPLGIPDTGRVIERLTPVGRGVLRLAWSTPMPVPEALRAITNRATSGQERLRYRSARTLLGALTGWLTTEAEDKASPIALLLDRLHSVGHLPALPGLAGRVSRAVALERQRTDEIARHILPDMALSFELLRILNTAQVQGTQVSGNGTVLTLRRVVALVGINGVRKAAHGLRAWPGPLPDDAAARLKQTMDRVRLAGHVAQALRPAGYDPEVVFLVALLQNLGRLLARYHFPDEAEQVEQLMRPGPATPGAEGAGQEPSGMSEDAAGFAVLGVDLPTLGLTVARKWGFAEDVLRMIRRLPVDAPVRKPDDDAEMLRILASAANEAVDVVTLLPPARVAGALHRVGERYGRILKLGARSIPDALGEAREVLSGASAPPRRGPAVAEPTEPAELAG